MYKVLSLDLGTNLGWCLIEGEKIIDSGVTVLRHSTSEPHGVIYTRFMNFLADERFADVDELFYEQVARHVSRHSAEMYYGLLAHLKVHKHAVRARMAGLYPPTWKKTFTGNGHAKKVEVCNQAIDLGWKNGTPNTDEKNDEADAIGIAFAIFDQRGVDLSF